MLNNIRQNGQRYVYYYMHVQFINMPRFYICCKRVIMC